MTGVQTCALPICGRDYTKCIVAATCDEPGKYREYSSVSSFSGNISGRYSHNRETNFYLGKMDMLSALLGVGNDVTSHHWAFSTTIFINGHQALGDYGMVFSVLLL